METKTRSEYPIPEKMITDQDTAEMEEAVAEFPLFEYAFIPTEDIDFNEKVRQICKIECRRYGTSWSCPPAVGTVAECRDRCRLFPEAFFFSTVHHVNDSMNIAESFQTKVDHEKMTDDIEQKFREKGYVTYRLSGDSCSICEHCAYPEKCRFPDRMHPCIEGHGILVAILCEKYGMDYYIGEHEQLWFSLICFRRGREAGNGSSAEGRKR